MGIGVRDVISATAFSMFALSSYAASVSNESDNVQYKASVAAAMTDYKAARSACEAKKGNDKAACMNEAKANLNKAKADAKASRKSKELMVAAKHAQMKADYEAAKKKCRAMAGEAKDAALTGFDAQAHCLEQARSRYHR